MASSPPLSSLRVAIESIKGRVTELVEVTREVEGGGIDHRTGPVAGLKEEELRKLAPLSLLQAVDGSIRMVHKDRAVRGVNGEGGRTVRVLVDKRDGKPAEGIDVKELADKYSGALWGILTVEGARGHHADEVKVRRTGAPDLPVSIGLPSGGGVIDELTISLTGRRISKNICFVVIPIEILANTS